MKAIEKTKLQKMLDEINKEVKRAEEDYDRALNKCQEENFSLKVYSYYQQRYEYLNGVYMGRTIIQKYVREMNK